jgi:hypothetical protein
MACCSVPFGTHIMEPQAVVIVPTRPIGQRFSPVRCALAKVSGTGVIWKRDVIARGSLRRIFAWQLGYSRGGHTSSNMSCGLLAERVSQ